MNFDGNDDTWTVELNEKGWKVYHITFGASLPVDLKIEDVWIL